MAETGIHQFMVVGKWKSILLAKTGNSLPAHVLVLIVLVHFKVSRQQFQIYKNRLL